MYMYIYIPSAEQLRRSSTADAERDFLIDNLLVRIRFIIALNRWTGLAPWEFAFTFPGGLASTLLTRDLHFLPARFSLLHLTPSNYRIGILYLAHRALIVASRAILYLTPDTVQPAEHKQACFLSLSHTLSLAHTRTLFLSHTLSHTLSLSVCSTVYRPPAQPLPHGYGYLLHPTPYTLHPAPYTLIPKLQTL